MDEGLLKRWDYKPLLGTILYTLVVPGSITVLVPFLILTLEFRLIPMPLGIYHYLGLIPICLGMVLYLWAAWEFAITGKGTPSSISPPKKLVVNGPYRWIRNPMYAGLLFILVGEAIFVQEVILVAYFFFFYLSFNRYIHNNEEPNLAHKFGANYRLYCHAIPRWLPRIRLK